MCGEVRLTAYYVKAQPRREGEARRSSRILHIHLLVINESLIPLAAKQLNKGGREEGREGGKEKWRDGGEMWREPETEWKPLMRFLNVSAVSAPGAAPHRMHLRMGCGFL